MKLVTGPFQLELSPTRAVDSEDWVRVGAAIAVAGFTGNFEARLQLEDLRRFIRELEVMYAAVGTPRTAELTSAEPDIRVRLQSQPLGGVLGNYRLENSSKPSSLLTGGACGLTPPSSGRTTGRFAPFGPPLMANVRPLVPHVA